MDNTKGGRVMVTKLSIAIAIGMCIGSGMAQPDLEMFAAAPAIERKIDFDEVFADVTQQNANEALPQTDEACFVCGSDRQFMTSSGRTKLR